MTTERINDLRQMAAAHPKCEWLDECLDEIDRLNLIESSLRTSETYWKGIANQMMAKAAFSACFDNSDEASTLGPI